MVVDRYLSTVSNYVHPQESNLLNIHKAMEYDGAGKPVVRVSIGTSTINISGPVNIPGSVEISNDVGNPVPIAGTVTVNSTTVYQGTDPWTIDGTVSFPAGMNDAFGRLRVSDPYTLFDSFHRYQDNGKISQYTTGTSTSTHSIAEGAVTMSVGTALGDAIYRESSKVFAYQPGKSLLILQTGVMGEAKVGKRTRFGYFDVNNGFYLERDGNDIYFVKRSTSLTGSPTNERVAKSLWNVNRLDGTGSPAYILNLDVAQILYTEIEWLGVGSVTQGFVINGSFVPCHKWNWANQTGSITSYMATACLPVRAELENIAATASTSTMKLICTSVISEGGYELRGRSRSAGHGLSTPYTLSNNSVVYPIFSMKLKSSRLGGIVLPKNYTVGIDKAANYRYSVVVGGTTTGGSWIDAGVNDSSVLYNLTASSVSGGVISEIGYINASNQASVAPSLAEFPFQYQLERNSFTNESIEFTICVETDVNTGPKAWCSVNWEEIT